MDATNKISYPPEWSDKERMSYLLAPFPPSDKPLSLDDPKFSFWSSLILSSSRELRTAIVTNNTLQRRFKWNGTISPGCLDVVLEGMERIGDVKKLSDFYSSNQSWLSWGVGVVKRPVSWALSAYITDSKYDGEYVISTIASGCATSLLLEHQNTVLYKSTDNIMKYGDFENLCLRIAPSDMVPIIAHLLLDGGKMIKTKSSAGHEIVKLSSVEDRKIQVTDIDIGVVSIKEALCKLSEQIKTLEETVRSLRDSAREKLKNGHKAAALRYVRDSLSKKSVLKNKEAMLDNMHGILQKIQSAETDAMVFQAYKSGLEALKFMNNSEGLSLEEAEDVMAELKEAGELNQDISSVLDEAPFQDDITDEELLLELEGFEDHKAEPGLQLAEPAISQQTDTPAQETSTKDLELLMASLSVKEDTVSHLLDQLPPVPDQTAPSTHKKPLNNKPLLA